MSMQMFKRKESRGRKLVLNGKAANYSSISTTPMKQDQIQNYLGTTVNLTISSPISGVMLMLLLRILRTSDGDAPPDLKLDLQNG